jgi:hypothetical protein
MMFPGRKSAFRAGFWPNCNRERPPISVLSGSNRATIRPGRPIYGPKALLRNMEYNFEAFLQVLAESSRSAARRFQDPGPGFRTLPDLILYVAQ